LAILLALFGLCLLLYVARIYTHLVPKRRLKAPDFVISLAVVLMVPVLTFVGLSIREGLGRHSYYISPEANIAIKYYQFWMSVLGIWVAYLARTSVACLLLQFDSSIRWRIVLYVFIVTQVAVPFSFDISHFNKCRPLRAMWEKVLGAKCWTKEQNLVFYYIVFIAISDLAFAIMPMLFIWKLGKTRIERVIITILMALGLCAMAIVIVRSVKVARRDSARNSGKDDMRGKIDMVIICRVEDFILIAATCAPFLKSPLQ
ncbi:hypothetical protein K469DRAFT_481414, partial [Zopfia rhizophila CBS 207.26]